MALDSIRDLNDGQGVTTVRPVTRPVQFDIDVDDQHGLVKPGGSSHDAT